MENLVDTPDYGETMSGLRAEQVVFGRYVLLKALGRGATSVVWLAHDKNLERKVALKFLLELVAADVQAIDALKRETRRSLALTHPHIVRIHDFVSDGRFVAISMEYVDGESLASGHARAWCRDPAALQPLLVQLCAALDYAHEQAHIVHRDLKPANLLVTKEGFLKVADFGISATLVEATTRVSGKPSVAGTLAYMSPQQLLGESPAVTDDIYSLGATLYELLTGQNPSEASSNGSWAHEVSAPGVNMRREQLGLGAESLPPTWEPTLAACLLRPASQRPQSVAELAQRLGIADYGYTQDAQGRWRSEIEEVPSVHEHSLSAAVQQQVEQVPASKPKPLDIPRSKTHWYFLAALVLGLGAYYGVQGLKARWELTLKEQGERGFRLVSNGAMGTSQTIEPVPATTGVPPETSEPAQQAPQAPGKPAATLASIPMPLGAHPVADAPWELPELGMRFVPVPGTRVLFSVWETRVQDFDAYLDATGQNTESARNAVRVYTRREIEATRSRPGFLQGPKHPVIGIDENDARLFCEWLTKRERDAGRLAPDQEYRIPSDEEWTIAAGPTEFPWGDSWPPSKVVGNYQDESAARGEICHYGGLKGYDDGFNATSPVGYYEPNSLGLFDLGGNVAERVDDKASGVRGASFFSSTREQLASSRHQALSEREFFVGFRVVCTLSTSDSVAQNKTSSENDSESLANYEIPGLGMRFVTIPGTELFFSIWETRVQDFRAFVAATGYDATVAPIDPSDGVRRASQGTWKNPGIRQQGNYPVTWMSKVDGQAFCAWLTRRERAAGRLPSNQEYRLPTNAEWLLAHGASQYPWGTQWPPPASVGNYADGSRGGSQADYARRLYYDRDDGFPTTSPVGSFAPNKLGLYDIGGNVAERTDDKSGTKFRGGSFLNFSEFDLGVGFYSNDSARRSDVGFRVVRAPVHQK